MINNCRKYIPLLILLLSVFTEIYPTENKTRYISTGGGWAHMGLRDNGISPLYYSGNHPCFYAGFQSRTDTTRNSLKIGLLYGSVTPSIYPQLTSSEMKIIKPVVSYSHMRLAGNFFNGKGKLFLGGVMETQFASYEHNRLTNSARNNYFFSTLNISSSLSLSLFTKEMREIKLHAGLFIPVVVFAVRPSYAYIKPAGFLDHETGHLQSLIKSVEISSLNKFIGTDSYFSLGYKTKNNNIISIGYSWEFFDHNTANRLESSTHMLTLKTMFNFW